MLVALLARYPEIMAWACGLLSATLLLCRGMAELLSLFAHKTKTKTDDFMLLFVSDAAVWLSRFLGWISPGNFRPRG